MLKSARMPIAVLKVRRDTVSVSFTAVRRGGGVI